MEALRTVSTAAMPLLLKARMFKPISSLSFSHRKSKSLLLNQTQFPKSKFTKFNAISPSDSTQPAAQPEQETETGSFDQDYKFDWFSHWYPLMPVCDLDKRAPCRKKVMGLDVVVWWDKNENEWKVFDDRCPHRLAPLSEGRIDQWGRLQCVYHGWCFGGSSDCKFIPQAPPDGPTKQKTPRKDLLILLCTPVSPGKSRLISVIPTKFWTDDLFLPRWKNHMIQNLIFDSDLYLLFVQERKLMELGPSNWQNVCFVPTKADANVVAYRKWLKKYAGGQMDWGTKFNGYLPPTLTREQLMDRYWSHVVNCSSCNVAYKGFKALQISLQVFSITSVAIMAASKHGMISSVSRNTLAAVAILCFLGSKWLSHFIYKNFHFHDYNHAFK
ncbi:putative pheophorbide a oxygenase [Helianthus debilis subsp. tardiflorus]